MSARIYGGIPLTLMMAVTLLQCGASAGWWPAILPRAAMLGSIAAWGLGLWLLWQLDMAGRETFARQQPAPALLTSCELPVKERPGRERRTTPRFAICCPVELDLHEAGVKHGVLRDISQGGARIAGAGKLESNSRGTLRIPGIVLPVPFIVVGEADEAELRVRFEISPFGLETFIRQLARLVAANADHSSFTAP